MSPFEWAAINISSDPAGLDMIMPDWINLADWDYRFSLSMPLKNVGVTVNDKR